MKKHSVVLFSLLILFSCSDNDDKIGEACGTVNPPEKLTWLKNEINNRELNTSDITKYFYISQATYYSQTVFVYDDCCPICNTAIFVYDCAGDRIGQVNADIQREDIKNPKIIYEPQDFACQVN